MPPDEMTDLLTAAEVARKFRVSDSTVSRWAKTGVLTAVRVGGSIRFRADDIEDILRRPEPAA